MTHVFWDSSGILFIDYLKKEKQLTATIIVHCFYRLKEEITRKQPHLLKKKCIFLQNNAPAHKSIKMIANINELRFGLLPHPPYSPYLAPSIFYLFPNLKRWLQG